MLLFDMTTTAINNHVGHRQTGRKPHYPDTLSFTVIVFMGLIAASFGIYLVTISGLVVLFVGILCFGIGIIYSAGPLPIARTPFGELFSGVIMGVCIPFIAVEISHSIVDISFSEIRNVSIYFDRIELASFAVVVLPLICCISNIMLANNICDAEEDIQVKRYTLPFYMGVKNSLLLYKSLYFISYVTLVLAVALGILPIVTLAVLLTIIPVRKNIKKFIAVQDKRKTFSTAIINFLYISGSYAVLIWLGCVLI